MPSEKVKAILEAALKEGRKYLLEHEAKEIIREYGIETTPYGIAKSPEEAVEIARKIGYPVVMKIVSPDIIHKSDVGGVVLNVKSDEEVKSAFERIINNVRMKVPNARIWGVIVEKQAPKPIAEVIIGAKKDPQFGHVVMFGLGGVFVEVLKDVSFRVAPLSERDAYDMISEIKGYKLLTGFRGMPPADIEALVKAILSVSKLVQDFENIAELDLNPIFVYEKGKGLIVVDARIILE